MCRMVHRMCYTTEYHISTVHIRDRCLGGNLDSCLVIPSLSMLGRVCWNCSSSHSSFSRVLWSHEVGVSLLRPLWLDFLKSFYQDWTRWFVDEVLYFLSHLMRRDGYGLPLLFPLDELRGGGPVFDVPPGSPLLDVSPVHKRWCGVVLSVLPEIGILSCVPLPERRSRISSVFLHLVQVIPIGVSEDLTMDGRPSTLISPWVFPNVFWGGELALLEITHRDSAGLSPHLFLKWWFQHLF